MDALTERVLVLASITILDRLFVEYLPESWGHSCLPSLSLFPDLAYIPVLILQIEQSGLGLRTSQGCEVLIKNGVCALCCFITIIVTA